MIKIMISGPDGTGKSTISNELEVHYENNGMKVKSVWLRFNHYCAKLVNIFGRLTGKSYYEKYEWGKVGYHDYKGLIGYMYIFSVYIDHLIFRLFLRRKYLEKTNVNVLIIDRYILDIMADLMVDTGRYELVLNLFMPFAKKEFETSKAFILRCDPEIVISRREDIRDDKSYEDKRKAYAFLANELDIKELDTGNLSVEEIIQIITKA